MLTDFDNEAQYYDLFERKNAEVHRRINSLLMDLFKKSQVQHIIDFGCGTGAQALPLSRAGFQVTGVDISPRMIERAQAKIDNGNIRFMVGDVRLLRAGTFDACIMILNSMGYLRRDEFETAVDNVSRNLTQDGYFIFDITNRRAIERGDVFLHKYIDTAEQVGDTKCVRFVEATVDTDTGIVRWQWESFVQEGFNPLVRQTGTWVRQTYTIEEITAALAHQGMKIIDVYDRNMMGFHPDRSLAFIVVARKVSG